MKDSIISILVLFIILNISCVNSGKKYSEPSKLSYNQAVEILKAHLLDEGLIKNEEEVKFLYEPDNKFWKSRYLDSESSNKIEEMFDLTNRDYYVFFLFLGPAGSRGPDEIVFIDKDEKRVSGYSYNWEYTGYPVNDGRVSSKQSCLKRSEYDQSIDIAKQYLVDIKYYEHENEVSLLYDPTNGFWKRLISWKPETLEFCDLLGKTYDAVECGILDSGKDSGYIFVDKNKKQVIGIFYYHDNRYVENTAGGKDKLK